MAQHQQISRPRHVAPPARPITVRAAPAQPVEWLPFTVKRVESEADLRKAVQIRHAAYSRHVPAFAQTLTAPEPSDYAEGTIVLLAESKLDGSALGSMRVQTNEYGPLSVEQSIELPDGFKNRRLAELSRLGVDAGRTGRLVRIALFKACFDYCEDNQIDYLVLTGRAPVDRQYEQLLCTDIFDDKAPIPLRHVGNIPHRVMSFEIATGEARWKAANHPLLNFFRRTSHPDIDSSSRIENWRNRARVRQPASTQLQGFAIA